MASTKRRRTPKTTYGGPVQILANIVNRLGWTWNDDPMIFKRADAEDLHLNAKEESWWKHEVREDLRIAAWMKNSDARKRESLEGCFQGRLESIDYENTTAIIRKKASKKEKAGQTKQNSGGINGQASPPEEPPEVQSGNVPEKAYGQTSSPGAFAKNQSDEEDDSWTLPRVKTPSSTGACSSRKWIRAPKPMAILESALRDPELHAKLLSAIAERPPGAKGSES